ncbi:hypothetical protein JQ594_21655 [Bradyrhizobium manausense]|uniref:hypothetical protein n=1 Tax=Bradyrhizobium manausense TaxID=989370 RepID=UPI001BA51E6B|nr:hypothetical protein [Bradyrhizobium manausense]MBR0688547.1 hypothetical protein [Bradyrhizobium manausense]
MRDPDYLIRRIVDGLSGWLVHQQAMKATVNEHVLYPAITQIAQGRGWKVRSQQKLVRLKGATGAPKQIDLLFHRKFKNAKRVTTVVLEVKYLRGENPSADRAALLKDMKKLSATALEDLADHGDEENYSQPKRFLLIAAHDSAFRKSAKPVAKNQPVAKILRKALREELPGYVYQTTTPTYLLEELHWIVAAFGEKAWSKLIT